MENVDHFDEDEDEEDQVEDIAEYWFDPTNNQITTETEFAGGSGAPERNRADALHKLVATGLRSDFYLEAGTTCKSDEQKKALLKKHKNQKPRKTTLMEANTAKYISSDESKEKLLDGLDSENYLTTVSRKCGNDVFYRTTWLHLGAPKKFGYSLVILKNFASEGLLHTFIRHWNQWQSAIPSLEQLMQSDLGPIRQHLKEIAAAPNEAKSKEKINNLNRFLIEQKEENQRKYRVIKKALFVAQMKVYRFLVSNTHLENYVNYLGEGVNNNCYIQVHFRIPNYNKILILAISMQLYPSISGFNKRSIRTVTTAFFIPTERTIAQVWRKN